MYAIKRSIFTKGFTIVELMVALAVVAIIISTAIPSFNQAVTRYRLTSVLHNFESAISAARNEAIVRGEQIVVCKRSLDNICDDQGSWADGWVVFVDLDKDEVLDTNEESVRFFDALSSEIVFQPNTENLNRLSFGPSGRSRPSKFGFPNNGGLIFDLCSNHSAAKGNLMLSYRVSFNALGRMKSDSIKGERKCAQL